MMRLVVLLFYLLLVPLCTLFVIFMVGSYWVYLDAGINASANSMALIYLYLPTTGLALVITMAVAIGVARNRHLSLWIETGLVVGSLLLVTGGLCAREVWRLADYPRPVGHDAWGFLPWLLAHFAG